MRGRKQREDCSEAQLYPQDGNFGTGLRATTLSAGRTTDSSSKVAAFVESVS